MNETEKERELQIDNPHLTAVREQSYALIAIRPRKQRQQGKIEQARRRIAERKGRNE